MAKTSAKRVAPAMTSSIELRVPESVHRELYDVAKRAGRSVAFVARRALAAAKGKKMAAPGGPEVSLSIQCSEEDGPDTLPRIVDLLAERGGKESVAFASAWAATRQDFFTWLEKQEVADRASKADDLDEELRLAAVASDEKILAKLASSPYVQVRVRVVKNPATPEAVLRLLGKDRDRVVREALENRRAAG